MSHRWHSQTPQYSLPLNEVCRSLINSILSTFLNIYQCFQPFLNSSPFSNCYLATFYMGFALFIFLGFFGFPPYGFVAIISNIFPHSHSQHVSEAGKETFCSSPAQFSFFWVTLFPAGWKNDKYKSKLLPAKSSWKRVTWKFLQQICWERWVDLSFRRRRKYNTSFCKRENEKGKKEKWKVVKWKFLQQICWESWVD